MSSLQQQLGSADRHTVSDYLDTVREVERRIQRAEQSAAESPLADLTRPTSVPEVWEDHVKLMYDLQVLALRADLTRVITFQMAREASTRTYPQIGVPEPHHPISHHTDDPEESSPSWPRSTSITSRCSPIWSSSSSARRTATARCSTTRPISSGSGLGNPNVHDHRNLPVVVASGAGSRIPGGRHVTYEELTPMANLHLALLDDVGGAPRRLCRQHRPRGRGSRAADVVGRCFDGASGVRKRL